MEAAAYFLINVQLGGATYLLLWTENNSGFDQVLAIDERVMVFQDLETARRLVTSFEGTLSTEISSIDLDLVARWLQTSVRPDPVLILKAWNIFWDIANGTGREFRDKGPDRNALYDKLFHANNLPAMTLGDEEFVPEWSESELTELREVMSEGIALVRTSLG